MKNFIADAPLPCLSSSLCTKSVNLALGLRWAAEAGDPGRFCALHGAFGLAAVAACALGFGGLEATERAVVGAGCSGRGGATAAESKDGFCAELGAARRDFILNKLIGPADAGEAGLELVLAEVVQLPQPKPGQAAFPQASASFGLSNLLLQSLYTCTRCMCTAHQLCSA